MSRDNLGGSATAGSWRRGTRHGSACSSPWRVERPSSVCVQGDGATWRDRDASGEARDGEAAKARRVAVPAARRQRREREREKGDGGGAIS